LEYIERNNMINLNSYEKNYMVEVLENDIELTEEDIRRFSNRTDEDGKDVLLHLKKQIKFLKSFIEKLERKQ